MELAAGSHTAETLCTQDAVHCYGAGHRQGDRKGARELGNEVLRGGTGTAGPAQAGNSRQEGFRPKGGGPCNDGGHCQCAGDSGLLRHETGFR